jgi:YVTN family beta-propeller protein
VGLSTNRIINGVFAIGLCAVMVAGCTSGGASIGTSAMPPQSQSSVLTAQSMNGALSTKAANGNVTFAIGIKPKTKTGRITPQYVSLGTQSLKILTDGANPVVVNIDPWLPNCPPNPTAPGSYICTASLKVPTGNHVFTVTTYDSRHAEGNVLSTNSTGTVYVKPTGRTTVPIVLEGVVQYVNLTLATANPTIGKAAVIGLTPILEDADHYLIVGPAPYEHPVTLTTTDSTNGPLSKSVLNSPADMSGITVNYNGAKVASITYSATATDLPAANVINAVLTPGATTKPEHQHLYVANGGGSSVSVFDVTDLAATPTTITSTSPMIYGSAGVAVDANGKLYVANGYRVIVFDTAHGNVELPPIIGSAYLDAFGGMAVDASGKLYVVNVEEYIGSDRGRVSVFDTAHGNAALPAITSGGLDSPSGVAVDPSGIMLYIANSSSVNVFDTADGSGFLPIYASTSFGSGVAVDASGKLYVASGSNSVSVFDTAHGNAALPAITGGGLNSPSGVAVDASGKLYVANVKSNSVSVFDTAHGNAALPEITGGGLDLPDALAVH